MYKLTHFPAITRLTDGASIPMDLANTDYQEYLRWMADGNTPLPADEPSPEEVTRRNEIAQAGPTARQWFKNHPATIDFIRLTPAEQEAAIDGMTAPQLAEVVKYLAIAVSALVKERYL